MVQYALPLDPAPERGRDAAIFICYAAAGGVLLYACILAARPRTDTIVFVLAPLLCMTLIYENLSLGVSALAGGGSGAAAGIAAVPADVGRGFLALRGSVSAFTIPLWVTALFELGYTVHKKRSANFMLGLFTFDQGHRRTHTLVSHGLRYSLWGVGIALLLATLTLNAPYTADPQGSPHTARFSYKGMPLKNLDLAGGGGPLPPLDAQDCIDFFPWVLFLSWTLVVGWSLWRYGTHTSTDINPTMFNSWCLLSIAALGVLLAWLLSPASWAYPYATNAAELCLAGAFVRTMGLVESNLRTLEEWDRTLSLAGDAVAATAARKRAQFAANAALTRALEADNAAAASEEEAAAVAAVAAAAAAAGGAGGGAALLAAATLLAEEEEEEVAEAQLREAVRRGGWGRGGDRVIRHPLPLDTEGPGHAVVLSGDALSGAVR